jgi:hypothetical protein
VKRATDLSIVPKLTVCVGLCLCFPQITVTWQSISQTGKLFLRTWLEMSEHFHVAPSYPFKA